MRFKSDISGVDDLADFLRACYERQHRSMRYLSSGNVGKGQDEGDHYFVSFLIDKKYVVRYSMPTAIRTFALLWLGVGPEYIPIEWLVTEESAKKFSWDQTTEAVEQNLALLDDYLAGRLL